MEIIKSIHIFGACLFIGNIIVSAFWKVLADRTRSIVVIKYATRLVNLTDIVFTGFGAALLAVSGHMLSESYGGVLSEKWIIQSYILFGISGILWISALVPIQLKQYRIVKNIEEDGLIPNQYLRLAKLWSIIGTVATIVPLPAIYLMIIK